MEGVDCGQQVEIGRQISHLGVDLGDEIGQLALRVLAVEALSGRVTGAQRSGIIAGATRTRDTGIGVISSQKQL